LQILKKKDCLPANPLRVRNSNAALREDSPSGEWAKQPLDKLAHTKNCSSPLFRGGFVTSL